VEGCFSVTDASRACKSAFTAKLWGDGAVVCRAEAGRPGPVVDQEFGHFETWTHANAFAKQLNEGLELDPAEVQQIITDSILLTEDLLAAAAESGDRQGAKIAGQPVQTQFLLAQLDLAITFCRMLHNKPSRHASRMIRNTRNAVFDAMHYIFRPECSNEDAEIIGHRLERLLGLLQRISPVREDSQPRLGNPGLTLKR
jgi:hypothetical protein